MTHKFYDIKTRSKIEAEVVSKVNMTKNGQKRFAFKSKTDDGRPLTAFVSEKDFMSADVPETK